MTTKTTLAEMLKENTGTHMLDSGGAAGRSWQQNAVRDFESEEPGSVSGRWGIEATHNVYHWLVDRVELDHELDEELRDFSARPERANDSYFSDAADWIAERFPDARGIYGEGEPVTVNTYNHESALSQVLQWTYLEDEERGPIYVLQIHGGADVRGGYTRPRVFTELGGGELALFDDHRIGVSCTRCDVRIESETGGYSWELVDGGYGGETSDHLYTVGDGDNVYCVACLRDEGAIARVEYSG